MSESGNIKVVVRCRPMNTREKTRGASNLIEFADKQSLVLSPPGEGDSRENAKATKKKAMPFSFDRAYDENTEQRELFEYVGLEVLEHSFNGFNTCVFAYGQTGSGKSHSMVGYAEAKGLIPLTCSQLFDTASEKMAADPALRISVEVSYIEIYNEKVRDLLNPKNKGNLKVREHPSTGPYVEDLSKLVVNNFAEIENLMDEGNKARTVAATNMNETSSRSHAVFTLVVTQRRKDEGTGLEAEKVSRISLVDLAGSERANATGATGSRLKEGANINRSLTTLGKVIAALAAASSEPASKAGKKGKSALDSFVPYRDSVLTWLLKDSLGGNSKTAMIAAISPADYEETLSTLRYADQAKKIKTNAKVNEDPNARMIRELKEELEMLRSRVQGGGGGGGAGFDASEGQWDPTVPPEKQVVRYQTKSGEIRTVTKAELQEQLEQSENILSSLNESWEEKLQKTQEIQKEREKALEELGISVDKGNVGVSAPKSRPNLVNLNEDPLMSECLIYQLKDGITTVGNVEGGSEGAASSSDTDTDSAAAAAAASAQIRLSGTNVRPLHCHFEVDAKGVVMLHARPDAMVMVNGKRVTPDEPRRLRSGYRVLIGANHFFRFNHPEEVRKARDRIKSTMAMSTGEGGDASMRSDSPGTRPDSPVSDAGAGDVDWTYARREAALAKLNGQDVNFDHLGEDDLDKLFEDISRARSKKAGAGGRPESRLSSVDDAASETTSLRPYSMSAFTDDTSIDPWGGAGSDVGSIKANGRDVSAIGTPDMDSTLTRGSAAAAAEDTSDLRKLVKQYEDKLRVLMAEEGDGADVELSDEQKRLARWALAKWKSTTRVSMAADVLSNAVLLKEANVISRELRKNATYQFAIVDEAPLLCPTSTVEAIAGLDDMDDVADPDLVSAPKPCVGVRVLDHAHATTYVWSLPKLEARLQKMRNLYTFIDRPEYSRHFDWGDPFYETPAPSYTFLGNALVPLNPLSRHVSARYVRVPIHSRHTADVIGRCNVELKFVSLAAPSKASNGGTGSNGTSSPALAAAEDLPSGHKLGFQIVIDGVEGLGAKGELERVHIQLRTSAFAGPSIAKDDILTSVPAELKSHGKPPSLADVRMRRTLSFVVTEPIAEYLRSGYAPIEFHARVRDAHLNALEAHDAARETRKGAAASAAATPVSNGNGHAPTNGSAKSSEASAADDTAEGRPALDAKSISSGRLSEKEMVSEQRHDILASIQLCELDASGEYMPVPVRAQSALDPGAFTLRQGLQRKLVIQLSHDSGRQFPWKALDKVELSEVRLLDPKGKVHSGQATESVTLKVPAKQQSVNFLSNGTSQLTAWAWWDSSVHDSVFLNRATSGGHRVLLRLAFDVEVESCAAPARFAMDVAVSITSRDSRPPGKLLSLIESAATGSRTLSRTSAVFAVRLVPPVTKQTKELWRLDTAAKYVRGEEALQGSWKPRGVSLVYDHARLVRRERRRAEVEGVKALLKARPPLALSGGAASSSTDETDLLSRCLAFWTSAKRESDLIALMLQSDEAAARKAVADVAPTAALAAKAAAGAPKPAAAVADGPDRALAEPTKLKAEVSLVPRTDSAAKRGWLQMPLDSSTDAWQKRWFVLRRPHLYVYDDGSETDESLVVHLGGSIRVEHDENVEAMLQRPNVFGLYTSSNSYFLQAPNEIERRSWMRALDSFHAKR